MGAVDLMNDVASLRRATRVEDDQGGWSEVLAPVADSAGKVTWFVQVSQPTATERVLADADGQNIDAKLYLEPDCPVAVGDLVDIEGDGLGHWLVLSLLRPSRQVYVRADCRRRQGEGDLR